MFLLHNLILLRPFFSGVNALRPTLLLWMKRQILNVLCFQLFQRNKIYVNHRSIARIFWPAQGPYLAAWYPNLQSKTKISMHKIYPKPFQAMNVAQCPSSLKTPLIDFSDGLILTGILTSVTTFAIYENTGTFFVGWTASDQYLQISYLFVSKLLAT